MYTVFSINYPRYVSVVSESAQSHNERIEEIQVPWCHQNMAGKSSWPKLHFCVQQAMFEYRIFDR